MSVSFEIQSSTGAYQVSVGADMLHGAIAGKPAPLVLGDAFFTAQLTGLERAAILIEAHETEKSLDRMPTVIERMRAQGVNRRTPLVAVGGGVIQDIAAFVASVYMRGLAWTYVPTTVLAMVDSCIGGKSSINVGPYKNLVGTFHPPQHIFIDPALARTLPRDQFASGLIEAAKICFCRGPEAFARYLAAKPAIDMPPAALEEVIVASLMAKKHFIEIDEFDKRERLLLNFGHTFGHALEGASHYTIPHGIAVGLGILCSLAFQRARGIEPAGAAPLSDHLETLIRTLPGLAGHLGAIPLDDVLERFASDKKHTSDRFTLILVAASGEAVLEQMPRSPALTATIREAIATTLAHYTEGHTA